MSIKINNVKMIEVQDWDDLVEETYGRPYSFQQQDGCQDRGTFELIIPSPNYDNEDNLPDSIPEVVNGPVRLVNFKAWLKRNPKQQLPGETQDYAIRLFWQRNFYPDINVVADDLLEKGLIEPGEYLINIDW